MIIVMVYAKNLLFCGQVYRYYLSYWGWSMNRLNKKIFILVWLVFATFFSSFLSYAAELDEIRAAIQAKGAQWIAGETSVSKLPPEERKKLLGALEPQLIGKEEFVSLPYVSLPSRLDWRNNGGNFVTPVKNQGRCGSCWAFATTAALESYTLIQNHTPNTNLDLSEQVLISCGGAGSCNGGYISTASDFIRYTGLPLESCYPYTATNGYCANACPNWQSSTYKIGKWQWVTTGQPALDAIKNALFTYGPLVTTMTVYTDFYYYSGGIYSYTGGGYQGGHAVTIVGYNDSGQYFIVKNSWGTGWGESGYFKIAYSEISSPVQFGRYTIAYLNPNPTSYTFTVSKSGTGSGTVTSNPSGISCGTDCAESYTSNTVVTLTATPATGSTFGGWGGDCSACGTNTSCQIVMTSNKACIATFNQGSSTDVGKVGDFNGDGKADILWRNKSTGMVTMWLMNGTSVKSWSVILGAGYTDWTVAGVGDFDGDGKADILWRNKSTGMVTMWLMNGTSVKSWSVILGAGYTDWTVAEVGDFNGDRKADILWRNTSTGMVTMWLMDGSTMVDWAIILSAGSAKYTPAGESLIGYGKSDILWRNITGMATAWPIMTYSDRDITKSGTADRNVAGVGRCGGDNKSDVLWQNMAQKTASL
jgi:C1A family cysteine protease